MMDSFETAKQVHQPALSNRMWFFPYTASVSLHHV
jgi:hypothetical protein